MGSSLASYREGKASGEEGLVSLGVHMQRVKIMSMAGAVNRWLSKGGGRRGCNEIDGSVRVHSYT